MASTWGTSWGTSWATSWDVTVVVPPVVVPPIPDVIRTNYTGRYLVTANRLAPYLHGSVWKKNWRDST